MIQIRKLETDLIMLEEKEIAKKNTDCTEATTKKDFMSGQQSHQYKINIQTYGEFLRLFDCKVLVYFIFDYLENIL